MLKNENIICISSIDWDFIWQGHQEIMSALAKNGNRVLFIENTGVRPLGIKDISRVKNRLKNWLKGFKGIRKEAENLYIFSPIILPFPYARIARWINRHFMMSILYKWMKVLEFSDPIVWTFLPTPLSLDITNSLIKKLKVYYCIDNFSVSSISAKKVKKSEEKLLKDMDLVFVTSRELYNRCRQYNGKVYIFPFGVNFAEFQNIRIEDCPVPEELKNLKTPIVGYVGGVHKWIDQGLVRILAQRYPQYSFVFVGPIQTDVKPLSELNNVYFLGNKTHDKIPIYIKSFDVCIIPYLLTDYTKNVYPTKLNEYLAMGKAVISTALPEILEFSKEYKNAVYIADGAELFGDYIQKAAGERDADIVAGRISAAKENSWQNRIEKMSELIEIEIGKKRLNEELQWKEKLIYFYSAARRRTFKFAIICLLWYLIFFKTPFIWFLASPLRISETPQKTEAILVFGGGVGETGSPGNSTIERARQAIELYQQGYADKIIFSSGYTYVYNDAENMKIFAVSMGVAPRDIILEQKANSTYENVIFSKKILDKQGWQSVILVSSPYNMRRAYLVFNKWAKDKEVFYVPVDKSQFYDRSFGIKFEQIKAIMHEYLAIAYYYIKRYI